MGYYASYNGDLYFKTAISDEMKHELYEIFQEIYGEDDFTVSVCGDDKYYEDFIYESFDKIKQDIKEGTIVFHGEDDCYWRFVFKDGEFFEEPGEIIWKSEKAVNLPREEREEFIGKIIDTAEDVLEHCAIDVNPDDPVFDGFVYDIFKRKLLEIMKNYNIFKGEENETEKYSP